MDSQFSQMLIERLGHIAGAACVCAVLTACGQAGDLYLPAQNDQAPATEAAPEAAARQDSASDNHTEPQPQKE
ncbi:MAG: LPS translocon maturation chaperone LptM [Panacagrimonas sp.]